MMQEGDGNGIINKGELHHSKQVFSSVVVLPKEGLAGKTESFSLHILSLFYNQRHTKRRLSWAVASQVFFWYDNDKDPNACFLNE